MATVAVVGTGRMGSAMARALARAGSEVIVFNRTRSRCEPLADELGARIVSSPAEAAAAADVTVTMLADRPAVEETWAGDGGVLEGAREGSVLVDSSTVPPDTLLPYADRARAAGAGILDAPVSGSVALADSGQLTIMAGGETDDLERAQPVLEQLAKQIFHMGPLGSGSTMKLAVNAVIFALNNAVAEALVLAERGGIPRELAYEVIANSAAAAPFVGYKRASFLDPAGAPVGFALELAQKDLRLISALADSVRLEAPQLRANAELIGAAAAAVGDNHDFSEVATYLRGRQG